MVMVATIVISAVGLWPSATPCRTETLLDPIDLMHPVTAEGVLVTARGASVKAMVVYDAGFLGGFLRVGLRPAWFEVPKGLGVAFFIVVMYKDMVKHDVSKSASSWIGGMVQHEIHL